MTGRVEDNTCHEIVMPFQVEEQFTGARLPDAQLSWPWRPKLDLFTAARSKTCAIGTERDGTHPAIVRRNGTDKLPALQVPHLQFGEFTLQGKFPGSEM